MTTVVNRLQPITLAGMKDVTFGDWVRKQRSDRGWSQSRVARELSRIDAEYKGDPSYISKLERGDVGTPLLESRERFHKIFHTSEQDLIDLGIVKQYDQWGREITHRAPATIALAQEVRPVYDDVAARPGYAISQRKRKLIEEGFGWMKEIGGLRRTRYRGMARTQMSAYLSATAYNLLRISRLLPAIS